MGIRGITWANVLLLALPAAVSSAPLFDSQQVVDVILDGPIARLSRLRDREPELPGHLRYTDTSGAEHVLDVIISTRGKSRLEICDNPPLRFTFDKDKTSGTLFEGQHKLKLVRQCMRGGTGRDWLLLEYGTYLAYNIITEYSFKVRPLSIVFRDSESRSPRERVEPAFLLEDDDEMAARLSRHRIRPLKVQSEQLHITESTHNLLFQYLIGNTDFALKAGPAGESCCHNGRVLSETGRRQDWIIVPYDFDYAGIINTKYAMPHEKLPIRQVSTRLYRGFCWQNDELENSIELFNRKRDEIESAFLSQDLTKSKSRRVQKYLERFYEIINDPKDLQKNLLDKCRGPQSLPVSESLVSPKFEKNP